MRWDGAVGWLSHLSDCVFWLANTPIAFNVYVCMYVCMSMLYLV